METSPIQRRKKPSFQMHNRNSRGFLDGLLDLLSEEVRQREFDLSKQISWDTISKKVMEIYGSGCEPSVTHMTVANEDKVLILVEEPAAPAVETQGKNKKRKKLVDLSKNRLHIVMHTSPCHRMWTTEEDSWLMLSPSMPDG
jgi:hypothetical protein